MAKKDKNKQDEISVGGSRAINKFRLSDVVMIVVVTILCLTCVVPFIHLAAKSISSNTAVVAKQDRKSVV